MSRLRHRVIEYAISLMALGAALLVRWLLDPVLGGRIPFATLLGAVAVAVGVGGLAPALLVVALGYVAGRLLFFEPKGTLALTSAADWITLAGYLFACCTVILFGILMRRATARQRAAASALDALNRRKDRLLATVVHELRNPLAPIRNAVELLRLERNKSTPTLAFASDMIDRQLEHLTRLIDDLVDVDRIARNELLLEKGRCSLAATLEGAIQTARPAIEARRQRLHVRLTDAPVLRADPRRLEQVFVNLLVNASKFTPPEGDIDVALELDGNSAVVRITDSGRGMDADTLPRIFEMFFQADRAERGLGIGLALVHQLVLLHGGSVAARSDGPGQGSEFIVRLPVDADPLRESAAAAMARTTASAAPPEQLILEPQLSA
jgi:signal transduction histidine kinase